MAELNTTLVEQWHPTANMDLLPTDFTAGSGKKVHWLCSKGHEWEAIILNRSKGQGCPTCAGRKILVGFNDLATTHSQLAAEWHPTKNGDLKVTQISKGSHKKVWWQDESGHEWVSHAGNRVSGNGCPYCANLKILIGFNDLATTHPHVASDWHPSKNKEITPQDVTQGVTRKVWWLCKKEHEYQMMISEKSRGAGCPICSNHRLLIGFNDLATTHPHVASQWHSGKNGDLLPNEVIIGSHLPAWWLCKKGHEWRTATIGARLTGSGCPFCFGRFAIEGETDLLSQNPMLASQWHPTKNGKLLPNQVTQQSNKTVWWICDNQHEWQSVIGDRYLGQSCPFCSNHQILIGYNDFASTHPEMAQQWHPTKKW
jgi:hypothetical protein